ncbi:DNA cytosine methyltransferase [Pontibacillus sp. HMF3514]|uniref:DNA cytosine methyltransferase n=1 Tax=Pontibacillus sp. HMF3514 TaxID=2692425 RepID=UPI00131F73EC|nr:DNA cytosine methyltransferase [Pontibacillus sp. HMF3514]QHE51684.1 DNA (cytosine-5-)-methyltransferase [Pontibacillus sp. HMF3514]
MLFKHVSEESAKERKKFFLEKINMIIRMVEEYCSLHDTNVNQYEPDSNKAAIELNEMGILDSKKDDLTQLRKTIGAPEYERLLQVLSYYHDHKEQMNHLLKKFYNSYRSELQRKTREKESFTVADFFAGAGGLSLGFSQEGFRIELANEIDELSAKSYEFNHPEVPNHKIINDDIKNIVDHMEDYIDTDIDVVIGGPPCQSFSTANQQRIIEDPRNVLYKHFVRAVEKIKPKFVIMENVKGMKKVADQVVEDFHRIQVDVDGEDVHYNMDYKIFSSYDFSVPQNRERLIYIGVRSDVEKTIDINYDKIAADIMEQTEGTPRYALKDALDQIKPLESGEMKNMTEKDSEISGKKVAGNEYGSNDYLDLINGGEHYPIVFNHKARYANENNLQIYGRMDQGDDSTSERIADIMPYKHRSHIFKDKYFKLVADKPSRTITAHMKMDCHSHIHPTQVRSLTPREAARVQSFPDDFVFLGPYLKTYMQIGNAVPPLMARGFAAVIKKYLERLKKTSEQIELSL